MAISAYVFMETEHGKAKAVSQAVQKLPFVKRSHIVTGPFDVICYIEAPDLATLGDSVVTKIQAVQGVVKSLTNIVVV